MRPVLQYSHAQENVPLSGVTWHRSWTGNQLGTKIHSLAGSILRDTQRRDFRARLPEPLRSVLRDRRTNFSTVKAAAALGAWCPLLAQSGHWGRKVLAFNNA
jgi:hypothetical protein